MHEETGQESPDMTRFEERLRTGRAVATGLELDQLKQRVLSQARNPKPEKRTKGQFMKSRLALLSMIVLGLMASSTGATLAISGNSGAGSAGDGQYRQVTPDKDDGQVLGDDESVAGQPEGGTDPASESGTSPQATAQVAVAGDGTDSLAFTGFLAIPLMIGGVALVATGAILRRKA